MIKWLKEWWAKLRNEPKELILTKPEEKPGSVDWADLDSPLGKYFKVKDAIWFPSWDRAATEADGLTEEIKSSLIETFRKLDVIREFLGKPIIVHVAFRSVEYNKLVKGAKSSSHLSGAAIDWHATMGFGSVGKDCDKVKELLIPHLEEWGIRLEDNGQGSTWLHIDTAPVISKRFFKP